MEALNDGRPGLVYHVGTSVPSRVQAGFRPEYITFPTGKTVGTVPSSQRLWYKADGARIDAIPEDIAEYIDFHHPFTTESAQEMKVSVNYYADPSRMCETFYATEIFTSKVANVTAPFDYGEMLLSICREPEATLAHDIDRLQVGGLSVQSYAPDDVRLD